MYLAKVLKNYNPKKMPDSHRAFSVSKKQLGFVMFLFNSFMFSIRNGITKHWCCDE